MKDKIQIILKQIDMKDFGFNCLSEAMDDIQSDEFTKVLTFYANNSEFAVKVLELEMKKATSTFKYRIAATIFIIFSNLKLHKNAQSILNLPCKESWFKALLQSYKLKEALA